MQDNFSRTINSNPGGSFFMTSKAAQKSRMISGYFDDGNKKPEKDGQERRGCTYFFAKTELSVPVTREGEKTRE